MRMVARTCSALSPLMIVTVVKAMRLPRAPKTSAGFERGSGAGVIAPAPEVCGVASCAISRGSSFCYRRRKPADICRGRPVDANVGDETPKEIVHMPLTSPALLAG